ncbi:MAG: tetratricopeptide repeat protein [Chloroflexi bacterium]|nr:tetratricopeptide repeat protein [Chloroflexota bacterium]
MKTLYVVAVVALLTVSGASAVWAQNAQQLFQQALSKERADGKLDEAIQLYRQVLEQAGPDRALASRALLQLGRCYERLGQEGAREAYERLLRDYADQAPVAAEAKTRLAALSRATPAAAARPVMSVRSLPSVGLGNDLQAISPDGTKAIAGDYSKGQNLAVFDFATKQSRLLTSLTWSDAWAYHGIWSRDGRQIAYMQAGWAGDSAAELRVVSAAGGEPRVVFRNDTVPGAAVRPAAWLPDGTSILALLQRPDRTAAMGLISVADGRFTQLRSFPWGATPDPAVSPDGRLVAFVDRTAGSGDLHVVGIDAKEAFRVTDHPADDREPMWSPDGRHIAFISNRFGAEALWAVEIEHGRPRGEPFKLRDGMHGTGILDWSSRGIAALQLVRSWDLYTAPMDRSSGRTTAAPQPLTYMRNGRNISPAWSPDGRQLAFISSSPSNPANRYVVVMAEGGQPREFLIPTDQYDFPQAPYDLRWFGNGRGLGFSGTDAKGEPALFRLTLDDGGWKTLPLPVKAWTRIEWNHDGSAYYFGRHAVAEGKGGLFERRLEGNDERLVYATPEGVGSSRGYEFGPDRKWLALMQTRARQGGGVTTEIVVVNIETGEHRTLASLTRTSAPNGPSLGLSGWSPDGRVLVQRSEAGGKAEWLLYPVDGATPQAIAIDIPPSPGAAGLPASTPLAKWSRDGSRIVFVRTGSTGGAFVIENPLAGAPSSSGTSVRR